MMRLPTMAMSKLSNAAYLTHPPIFLIKLKKILLIGYTF